MAGWKMCLLIAAFSLASPALAQHYNAANALCKQAGSGVDQVNCLTMAAQRADKALDIVYDQILIVTGTQSKNPAPESAAGLASLSRQDLRCRA
ncbi:hypothetical protein BAR24_07630 [Gluconobacter oxydans]|uniref:hypothetical protein n=1 Tax=Gluconobacter thailandicus TaxID=257438 RepID=UPI0002996343|nr:hypothetical protein [Gluconobacter thailandicus]AFV99833.1 hypothetical protein B932_0225 [Gluconobacter oxydans H24]ANQ41337.1 hypothetical protein BAR24_07630 [Gluconobacter oxydans]